MGDKPMIDMTREDSRHEDWELVLPTGDGPPTYVYQPDRGLRVSVRDVRSVMRDDGPNVCATMHYSTTIGGKVGRIVSEYGDNDADAARTLIESFEAGQIDVPEVNVDDAEG